MEINPIKVIQVSGIIENRSGSSQSNLSLDIVTHLQRDYANFNEGAWELCLKDVCTEATNFTRTFLFEVSTNFVYGQYTQTERRQPIPLERFTIKKVKDESKYLNTFAPSTWYAINSPSAELRIYVKHCANFANSFPNSAKLVFTFTILFRRIK